jgi:nucleoside-diphosphate-sugar epimerase
MIGRMADLHRIAVTGGSGKAGRAVVRDLLDHGYDVLNVDRVPSPESSGPDSPAPLLPADLTDLGQAIEALSGGEIMPAGIDAVVHLAAIPSPVHATPDVVFRNNVLSTDTVFAAAARLGLTRVVWASSETTLGLPFDRPPDYAPVDEAHVYPESQYALSKVLGETMATQFARWTGTPHVALRLSNVMVREDYAMFGGFQDDPHVRKWNLWGYVDESHVAESVRLGLEADVDGAQSFVIAAADTVMRRPSRELMAEVFPGVPVRDGVEGTETLLDIGKARRVLGYAPAFTWRDLEAYRED